MKWYIESRTNFRGLDHEAEKSGLYRVIGELVKISQQKKSIIKAVLYKDQSSSN